MTLADCVPRIDAWAAAARAVNPRRASCSATADPSPRRDDAEYILSACRDCQGFYGASSMERLPTEVALTATTREFKNDPGNA